MTHAESQDLLLDLAYGELDAARSAEVASHVEGCAECRQEKAAIEEARRVAGPLRELEEPPAGFDDRILAAARAQAQLEHDGNVGQVIEVTGTVRPLGMEAARIDAHGPVKARPGERHRPRWMLRAALGGSVAAAAALALVVSTTLETRRNRETAVAARSEEFKIHVEPAAPQSLDRALRDAEAKREKEQGESQKVQAAPQQPPAEALRKDKVAQLRVPKNRPAAAPGARIEGAGGDVAGRTAPSAASSNVAEADLRQREISTGGSLAAKQSAPQAVAGAPADKYRPQAASPSPAKKTDEVVEVLEERGVPAAVQTPPQQVAEPIRRPATELAKAPAAGDVEGSAQQARHAGDYVLAASLYRQAAALRGQDKDAGSAAWNLAHAVECLSAVGKFDEARSIRDELARAYPSETSALSAARRALREVEPVPAAKQR